MLCCFPWSIQVTLFCNNMKKWCWDKKVIQTSSKNESLSFAIEISKYVSTTLEEFHNWLHVYDMYIKS